MAFDETGRMHLPRMNHAAVLLDDGRMLLVGNQNSSGQGETAEVFELR